MRLHRVSKKKEAKDDEEEEGVDKRDRLRERRHL